MRSLVKASLPRGRRVRSAPMALTAVLFAVSACETSSGPRISVARVEVNLASPTILVGTTAVATARAFDINNQLVAGVTPAWRSDAVSVVTVDKSGVLSALTLGTATIFATIGGVTGTAPVTVVPLPVASVTITPNGGSLDRGQNLQLQAIVRDQFGGVLTDRTVTWTSTAPGIALVSASGFITTLAAGTAIITATAEAQSATITINVIVTPVPGGPSIVAIDPPLLLPGGSITITGNNFGTTPALNEVRVAGVLATITNASATAIVAQLPASGFGCEPTRDVFVQVAHGSVADAKLHTIQVSPQLTLAPGESRVLSNATDARCLELEATGGRYVVSVYNTATQIAASAAFRLRGARGSIPPGGVQPGTIRAGAPAPTQAPLTANTTALAARLSMNTAGLVAAMRQRSEADAHRRIYEENVAFLRRNAAAMRARVLAGPPPAAARANVVTANQAIGSIVPFKIPNVGGFLSGGLSFCTDNFQIGARVVYNGTRAIVVEDTAKAVDGSPTLVGTMDSLFIKVGQEFDAVMYDIDRINFGDPLRMDDLLDNNGKIVMLFSPRINTFSGIAGFVVTCDFHTVQEAPSSNHAEVFYARVPLDPRTGFTDPSGAPIDSRSNWYRTIRSTIVHEVKHIAAFATKIRDFNQSLEDFWLEEGTARQAEEIWARSAAYNGLLQGANAQYATTLFCDVRPASASAPQCAGKPYAVYRHFGQLGLYDYLSDNETRSPLGPKPGVTDGSFYASAWSLVRWALDNHPVDEPTFLTSIVHTPQTGVTNLTSRLGRPWEEILGEWSLALYLDDFPGFTPANTRLAMPSWNFPSIFAGLHTDFPVEFPVSYPLVPRAATYGDFTFNVPTVAGGSFSMFLLSGTQSGRQLLQLLGASGGDPDPVLRVAIARID